MAPSYDQRVSKLRKALEPLISAFQEDLNRDEAKKNEEKFGKTLQQITNVVREAAAAKYEKLDDLVLSVETILKEVVDSVTQYESKYGESDIPSFAHHDQDAPLVKDTTKGSARMAKAVLQMMSILGKQLNLKDIDSSLRDEITAPQPWEKTPKPHPSSSRCARYVDPLPDPLDGDFPRAAALLEARCEISDFDVGNPRLLKVSSGRVAHSCMSGWKDRVPYLSIWKTDESLSGDHISFKVDLADTPVDLLIAGDRELVFIADRNRIKSYNYTKTTKNRGYRNTKPLAVHTLSGYMGGPLAYFGSRILQTGSSGKVSLWDLDSESIQTHGEKGTNIIGEEYEELDSWRDDPEDVEMSSGNKATSTFKLSGPNKETPSVGHWQHHPSQQNVMICGMNGDMHENPDCHAYDLEGGKLSARYIGHGGSVTEISTSPTADPNVFLTACNDGHARLYDVRHPLPILTIQGDKDMEMEVSSAILAHPDGIPFVFTGSPKGEDIKVWDIRGRKLLYELATGNNDVLALAWEDTTNSLYASTYCPYIDRMGENHGYRQAKHYLHPEMDGDDSEDDEIFEEWRWPERAEHQEDYFGHVFDSGRHRIFKYQFKDEPDTTMLPQFM